MVDRNRQATIQTLLSDGTVVYFYFYSAEICEVYHDQTRVDFFSYSARDWKEIEISSDLERGLKWSIDSDEVYSLDQPQEIVGIRFNGEDGPGYYESATAVYYLDNFAIEKGTLLSAPTSLTGNEFSGKLYFNGEDIILENPPAGLQRIELYNINGQMFKSARINDSFSDHYKIPLQADHPFVIVVLFDDQNKWYSRKIMINEP